MQMKAVIGNIIALILAVVVLVVFLTLMPTIISNTNTAAATTGIDTGTAALINQIPLVAAVGGIATAGAIAFIAAKNLAGGLR